jgi:hypothetical protein
MAKLEQVLEVIVKVEYDDRFHHHEYLRDVALEDVRLVTEKDKSYGASWKKRGGPGAFMMLARKWDRLEQMISGLGRFGGGDEDAQPYDVFAWIEAQGRSAKKYSPHMLQGADGTVLAEVRDLRRYLLLVEAEMVARGAVPAPQRDSELDPYKFMAQQTGKDVTEVRLRMAMPLTEKERLVPRGPLPREPYVHLGAGTPEDGGHHAGALGPDEPEESWGGPRYGLEINHKERSELPPNVQAMYRWYDNAGKWIMEQPYRARWCKDYAEDK